MKDKRRHGDYAGYQQHQRRHEVPCQPCAAANAAYLRRMRSDPEFNLPYVARKTARNRALKRLAGEYEARYLELVREELAAVYAERGLS